MDFGSDKASPINKAELRDVDMDYGNGNATYTIDDDMDTPVGAMNGDNNHDGSIPLDNAEYGSSLPTSEELKTAVATTSTSSLKVADGNGADSNRAGADSDYIIDSMTATSSLGVVKSRRRFKRLVMGSICVVLLVVIIGIAVAISKQRQTSASSATAQNNGGGSSSTTPEPRKVDINTLQTYLQNAYGIKSTKENTPQHAAAMFMSENDLGNMELPKVKPTTDEDKLHAYRFLARYIMILNFYAMGGTVTWSNPLNFLTENDICDWKGRVYTGYDTPIAGIFCKRDFLSPNSSEATSLSDEELSVPETISLYYNNLTGNIPTENGLLTTLRVFDVKWNKLTGPIPPQLCNLDQLRSLFIGYNDINGTIPTCIGKLTNLERIFTSNNALTGELPTQMAGLTNLQRVIVDDNILIGDPTLLFRKMLNLSMLMLNENDFTGTINSGFLTKQSNLTVLDLSNNNFSVAPGNTIALPRHLLQMPSLEILDLSMNDLTGSLPADLFVENSVLNLLNLYNNTIEGSLPSTIALLSNLTHLDVSDNQMTGLIPAELYTLSTITTLFLSNNPLEAASIPTQFSKMSNLKELSMRNTNRHGPLIQHLGGLRNLVLLDLAHNNVNGTIPDTWGNLTTLEFLLLQNNTGIVGTIPSTFVKLQHLRAAFFDGTQLNGTMDPVCSLPAFQILQDGDYIFANCNGITTKEGGVDCACCTCCDRKFGLLGTCSNPSLANLDAKWEFDYKRFIYEFWNNQGYLISSASNN